MWAVLLGVVLVLVAATSGRAAVTSARHPGGSPAAVILTASRARVAQR